MSELTRRQILKSGAITTAAALLPTAMKVAAKAAEKDEFALLDTVELAALVRDKQVSPRELVEAAIRRIEATNPVLNAVVHTWFDEALMQATDKNLPNGPFRGVPILVKDISMEGKPDYSASRVMADNDVRYTITDEYTRRIGRAGMITLGQTNVPELYSSPTTEPDLHGPCRNPWNTNHSAGGSSGGSGSAVAALMTSAAQASDGGGSTRIPASANGLVGLKPSRGLVSLSPSKTDWVDITTTKSWLTRTIKDYAALMDVIAGPGPGDTVIARPPEHGFASAITKPLQPLRIGFMKHLPGNPAPISPDAVTAVENSASLLADLGHRVEEAFPEPLNTVEHFPLILSYWPFKVAQRVAGLEASLGRPIKANELEPGTFKMLQYAREHSISDFAVTLKKIYNYSLRFFGWYDNYDVLLTPTTGSSAPEIGAISKNSDDITNLLWGGFAPIANITGAPALSLPLHWTDQGMPLGVQFVGNRWQDAQLLQLGAQLEEAKPWRQMVPFVHG
ncbi:MAG: amidase [bacterium]